MLPSAFLTTLASKGLAVLHGWSSDPNLVQVVRFLGEPVRSLSESDLEVLKPKAKQEARPKQEVDLIEERLKRLKELLQ